MFLGAASIQQRLCCVGFHHGPKMVLRAVNTALKPCLPCPMPALATGRHGGPSRELPTVHTAPKPCQTLPAFPIACLAIFTGWHGPAGASCPRCPSWCTPPRMLPSTHACPTHAHARAGRHGRPLARAVQGVPRGVLAHGAHAGAGGRARQPRGAAVQRAAPHAAGAADGALQHGAGARACVCVGEGCVCCCSARCTTLLTCSTSSLRWSRPYAYHPPPTLRRTCRGATMACTCAPCRMAPCTHGTWRGSGGA